MKKQEKKQDLTKQICKALAAKQANDILIVNVKGVSDIVDHFIIASGKSQPQVKAIFEHLEEEMEKQGVFATRKEGASEGRWIAVDYFDVIVHIFNEETRKFYQLEKLWINGGNCVEYTE